MKKKSQWRIFFIALTFCLVVNYINKAYLPVTTSSQNSKSLVYGSTIYSIDNEWYLNPAVNYIKYGIYAVDVGNDYTKVRRAPGYPVFYGLHYILFGENWAHHLIVFTQSILFALSALLLGLGVFNFTNSERVSVIAATLYAVCPFTAGYAFYTITEAVHPSLVIFTFYFLSKCSGNKARQIDVVLTGVFFAVTVLVRPANILFAVAIICVAFARALQEEEVKKSIRGFVVFGLNVSLGFWMIVLPWVIRNYQVTRGEIVLLEKFYHESPMGMGRSQTYLSKWWMCFGNPRPESFVYSLIESNKLADSVKYNAVDRFVNNLPGYAFSGTSREQVKRVLMDFQDCYQTKRTVFKMPIRILSPREEEPKCEQHLKSEFLDLIQKFKESSPLRYYFISPYLTRGKEYFIQSFSSMYGSLNPTDRKFSMPQVIIKSIMYFINFILWLSCIFCLFSKRFYYLKTVLLVFIAATFVFYTNFAHCEARYMIAAYPFLYVLVAMIFDGAWNRIVRSSIKPSLTHRS